MSVNVNANGVSPKAGAEPEEEEEAVALGEAGQEGEDQVDGEDVDQTLPPPHLVTQTPPHQRPHHHGHIHQQTCTHKHTYTNLIWRNLTFTQVTGFTPIMQHGLSSADTFICIHKHSHIIRGKSKKICYRKTRTRVLSSTRGLPLPLHEHRGKEKSSLSFVIPRDASTFPNIHNDRKYISTDSRKDLEINVIIILKHLRVLYFRNTHPLYL